MQSTKIFFSFYSLLFSLTLMAQPPMEQYALALNRRIITLEKSSEEYQSRLRYYQMLPRATEVQKQKIRELEQTRTKGVEQRLQLQSQINEENQRLQEMTTELSSLNSLIKEASFKLASTINDLNKSRKEIDSLVSLNKGLKFMIDEAMTELSGIKYLNLGVRRKDGSFVYKVAESANKIRFVCPRDIGVFHCDLTHASFQVLFYDKENLKENLFFLVFYIKDEYGQFVYYSHLQIGFYESESRYEGYHLYKSDPNGAVNLPRALRSDRDYVIGVLEFKPSAPDLDQITLPYAQAINQKLLKATKMFAITP